MTFIIYEKLHGKFKKLFIFYARNHESIDEEDEDE